MKFAKMTLLMTVALLSALMSPLGLAAQNTGSKIITFDAPGAGTGAGQGTGCFGCTFGINQWGTVVGTYLDTNNVFHGFVRNSNGKFTTFQARGADTTPGSFNGTTAESINDFGVVTGYYADATGITHGFLRSPEGRFTTFDAPDAANGSFPIFLNLEGEVAGFSLDANLVFHAFLRRPDGTFTTFVGPGSCTTGTSAGCFGSAVTYVDLFGSSAGGFEDVNLAQHSMIRSAGGKLIVFDVPEAGTGMYQGTGCPGCNLGVNFFGAIAGIYSDSNNVFHGFLRSPEGKFTTFDVPEAGTASFQGTGCFSDCAVGLNDEGLITGSYQDSNFVQHGYLRTPEGAFVTIDPPGSVATQPEGINDSGTIVGYYVDANNVIHGFLRVR